ncbi:MAG: endonuclease [Hyphococcus sp.]|nr:MAG: endonuclease [Marinicaulis sp.]
MRIVVVVILFVASLIACGKKTDARPQSNKEAGQQVEIAQQGETVRFSTYNVFLNRPTEGQLAQDLATPDNLQAQKVAEIIQRARPDVLLLNEFDYDEAGVSLRLFQENYLEVSQNGAAPAIYPHVFFAPSNTGLASGQDLNRDGVATMASGSREYGGDAFGYGEFPGQYAMVLLSKYPIAVDDVRTFQKFLWRDMPGALLPDDAATPEPADWYSKEALAVFRLSSKSHWDIPVIIDDAKVHVLASHPTPPSFDGEEDRNGKRNHDELRLWADYISGSDVDYLYDDTGERGGFGTDKRFVIMGDLNADPNDGGSYPNAIDQLLDSPLVSQAPAPASVGGEKAAILQAGVNKEHKGAASEDTADFNDDPEKGIGNLRLDYVLASKFGLREVASGVFWPAPAEPHHNLIGSGFPVESSDHRLVWRDLEITAD